MAKFDGVLLCSDIDGTLVSRGIPEENCKAIKYFQDNGGRFTICTGRYLDFFDKYTHLVTLNAPVIVMNGAIILDKETGKELFVCPLSADPGKMVTDALREIPYLKAAHVYPEGNFTIVKLTEEGDFEVSYIAGDGLPPKRAKDARELNELFGYPENVRVYKIVFAVDTERSDDAKAALLDLFRDFSVFRSWINGVEVQSPLADKGKGARMLADILGDVKLLVCAGDYENDISMVEEADIGYAVANAHPALKAVADRVTKAACAEGAIAEIIYDLDKELS